ncbi:UNVERIFIED_CONTAM: putative UDP-3-O-acylglucosamine N-acyltransferase 2, mitochondrial [Sesamum radiatum]|uniref:UDP-3-O-acylglucosamine N-acyltransferase 2, mitochondrial n=1 Tax=Sesamum radiatum TaxID=300843 RepID=A0AAW2KHZ2_SESRA
MALRIAELATLFSRSYISAFRSQGFKKFNVRTIFVSRPMPNNFSNQHPDPAGKTDDQEFQKWCNGGGTYHKSAHIDPTAQIEIGAVVHSESVVGANVCIGSGTIVGPAVTIGQSTRIGFDSVNIFSPSYNVVFSNCSIGDFCVIHHGVAIGQDGFGFFVDEQGIMVKKPQSLKARIGNHVEIGANTCIDRGSWRDAIVGDHTKIDNLVQIGHNVEIGKGCMLCGQVGIAGSVTIGDYVTLGGRVSIRDHVCIASKVRLAANSCVTKHREAGDYGGFPAVRIFLSSFSLSVRSLFMNGESRSSVSAKFQRNFGTIKRHSLLPAYLPCPRTKVDSAMSGKVLKII